MKENIIIRLERENEYREVENLVRESFWNVYRPGCLEHYVLHTLRNDPAFVSELDFVMTLDGQLIGQNMFMKAVIAADDGRSIPIMTMGRSVLHRSLKGRGMERFYWIILWKKQKSLDAEQYALKEILIFMKKADLNRQASLASAIMDCRKARMHLSFCAKN